MSLNLIVVAISDILAIAGGGGSGGGGGGSSSGGGGSFRSGVGGSNNGEANLGWFVYLGLVITLFYSFKMGIKLKNYKKRNLAKGTIYPVAYYLIAFSIIISGLLIDYPLELLLVLLSIFSLITFSVVFFFNIHEFETSKKVRSTIKKQIKPIFYKLSENDDFYNKKNILKTTNNLFKKYQSDWSNLDIVSMKSYMSNEFYEFNTLFIEAMNLRSRTNIVNFDHGRLFRFIDISEDGNTIEVTISGIVGDKLIDNRSDKILYNYKHLKFRETWVLKKRNNKLLIEDIKQSTEEETKFTKSVKEFSKLNNFKFRLDMGYLLLPNYGRLFYRGGFFASNLDNYVIGYYKDVLLEMYTYEQDKYIPKSKQTVFTIVQSSIPKSYGSIFIVPKNINPSANNLFGKMPDEYRQYETESNEFNNRYEVYATDLDKVTIFELLQPVYMAELIDTDLTIGIEVVDNTLYIFSSDKNIAYETMYDFHKKAYDEIKK
jgi:hypothetical protein